MAQFTLDTQALTSSMAIIRIAGEMTPKSFSQLDAEIRSMIDSGVISLILDVEKLEKITSSVLGLFLHTKQEVAARKGRVMLSGAKQDFAGLIRLLGIAEQIEFADSVEEAQDLLAGP